MSRQRRSLCCSLQGTRRHILPQAPRQFAAQRVQAGDALVDVEQLALERHAQLVGGGIGIGQQQSTASGVREV
jgi:hypothetical protein